MSPRNPRADRQGATWTFRKDPGFAPGAIHLLVDVCGEARCSDMNCKPSKLVGFDPVSENKRPRKEP